MRTHSYAADCIRLGLAGALVVFAFAALSFAQVAPSAPCAPAGPVQLTLHWRPTTAGGAAAGYRAYLRPAGLVGPVAPIDVALGTSNADGTVTAMVPRDPTLAYSATMTAYNWGVANALQESDPSNAVALPALCPAPPSAPALLADIAKQARSAARTLDRLAKAASDAAVQLGGSEGAR